jgi:hypothetical protein
MRNLRLIAELANEVDLLGTSLLLKLQNASVDDRKAFHTAQLTSNGLLSRYSWRLGERASASCDSVSKAISLSSLATSSS